MKDNIRNAKSINDLYKKMIEYYKETMLSYCLKCRKNTESINPKVSKTSNGKGLLSNLGLRTPLNKIPVLGDILF